MPMNVTEEWEQTIQSIMARDRCPRALAVRKAVKEQPELHASYIRAVNQAAGRDAAIAASRFRRP